MTTRYLFQIFLQSIPLMGSGEERGMEQKCNQGVKELRFEKQCWCGITEGNKGIMNYPR